MIIIIIIRVITTIMLIIIIIIIMAYPEDEVEGGEGQAAGEADGAPSHKAGPRRLQPPPLLHIPKGLSLGALLEAQPCTTQGLDHQHSCSKLM